MVKINYSGINVKAAAITGGVVGFLCWLLIIPQGSSGYMYGMMGYITGYGTGMAGGFGSLVLLSMILDVALGAMLGIVIALVYNWAIMTK